MGRDTRKVYLHEEIAERRMQHKTSQATKRHGSGEGKADVMDLRILNEDTEK